LAATPAAAAPPAWSAPGLVDALAAWLAALWPGGAPGETPAPVWATVGGGGEPAAGTQLGGDLDPDGEPTAEPQLGGDLDPNG
jgi:hypothetical protein